MKHVSLLWKLLALFIGVSVSLFIVVNTVGLNLMQDKMLARTKEELYQDGTLYVSNYLLEYYKKNTDVKELSAQFELLGSMTDARIWLVHNNGQILMDSKQSAIGFSLIEADAEFLDETFRENVYFKGIMEEPVLSVTVPVIHEYVNKGFLVLSVDMSDIEAESIYYLDFVNVAYLIFQPILLVIFAVIYGMTAVPVQKMTRAAQNFSKGNFFH